MVTLQQLKEYLQTNGTCSLLKIAQHFAEEPKQVMLIAEHYIAKGKICCEQKTPNCGSCHGCFASNLINLSWVSK